MKKSFLLILLCCLLTGCAAPPADREPGQAEPPPAPPPTAAPAPEGPCAYILEMMDREDSAVDEDGVTLAAYRVRLPVLTACRADGAAIEAAETEAEARALAAAETFNAEFAAWTGGEQLQELADMAREERAWRREAGMEWDLEFFTELDCRVYETDRLISVARDYYSYTGGAHPNTILTAWNFDLETGAFFAPEQLAEDGEAFSQAVQAEIVRQIRERAEENGLAAEEMFWSNYEEIAGWWSSYAVSFDEAGMTVAYSPYELAAYAAGPQSFRLSYDFLAPYLGEYGRAVLGPLET